MYEDRIYQDFHLMNEHFTVEDYGEDGFALYHEDMFVAELADGRDASAAYGAARDYMFACGR